MHGLGQQQPQEQGARFEQTKTAATKRKRGKQAKKAASKKRRKTTPLNPGKVSSKFFGVSWLKREKKWRAQLWHNGKKVYLGDSFDTEIAAAKAVDVRLRENGRAAEANFDESGSFVPRVSTKSSKYRGVAWRKDHNQWEASIKVAGKMEHLGYFDDEREAARAFDTRAAELGRPTNFDLNGVEIDYGSDAVLLAQVAQAAAWDAEVVRNAAEAAAQAAAGNLTKGRGALINSGPSDAVAMLTAAAPKFAKQEEAREVVGELVERHGWDYDLGNADRGIYPTANFSAIPMDLGSYKLAAEMQLTELNRQQPAPANTLDDVLKELKLTAHADTMSNDYIQAVELCKEHEVPVILPDRGIIIYYRKDGRDQNYLAWPADSLPTLHTDSNFDNYLVDVLGRVFAEQDRNGEDRDPNVVVAFKVRTEPEITEDSQVHPELFEQDPPGGARSNCTLKSWWDERGRDNTERPAGALSAAQKKDLRAELKEAVEERQEAAGGTERPRYKFEADHLFSCWLITCLLMQ